MNDLQSKFALTLIGFGLLLGYALPEMKRALQGQDAVISQVGQVYIAPDPKDPSAPSGMVSADQLQRYAAKKAAERTLGGSNGTKQ